MRFRDSTRKKSTKINFQQKNSFSSENRNMSNEQVTFAVALLVESVACEMSSEHETTEVDRNISKDFSGELIGIFKLCEHFDMGGDGT